MRWNSSVTKNSDQLVLFQLPLFFVFHGFVDNYPSILLKDALYLLAIYELAVFIFAYLFGLLLKDRSKASLFTFLFFCIFFFFGAIHDSIKHVFPQSFIGKYSFILPVVFLTLFIIFYRIRKTGKSFFKIFSFLAILFTVFLLFDALTLLLSQAKRSSHNTQSSASFTVCDTCTKPDIYLIILDEYAGKKSLNDIFNFDNSSFYKELSKRGFNTIKQPKSNYNYTPYSIASLLSMDYLQGISSRSNNLNNLNNCYQKINNNQLVEILKANKYKFYNNSIFDFANLPTLQNNNPFYSTHAKILTSQTLSGRLSKDLYYHLITSFNITYFRNRYLKFLRKTIDQTYSNTVEVAKEKGTPKFVYTHFIMPHYPYLFTENGNLTSFDEAMDGGNKKSYLGYLKYSNKLSLSLIDRIHNIDHGQSIIILMSDHGFTKYHKEYKNDYNFMNMINIYLPKINSGEFSDSLTNINLFRSILNLQLNQKLPYLKDSSVFLVEY